MPKTVQLSEDAYATLAALKAPGESFSMTVKRLAASRKNPLALLRLPPLRKGFDLVDARRRMAEADLRRWRALTRRSPETHR